VNTNTPASSILASSAGTPDAQPPKLLRGRLPVGVIRPRAGTAHDRITPVVIRAGLWPGPHSRYEVATAESTPRCHDARKLCARPRRRSDACLLRGWPLRQPDSVLAGRTKASGCEVGPRCLRGHGLVRSFTDAKSRTCRSASLEKFQAQNVDPSRVSSVPAGLSATCAGRGTRGREHQCNQRPRRDRLCHLCRSCLESEGTALVMRRSSVRFL